MEVFDRPAGHVSVLQAVEVDTESYAEAELSDAELLGIAAQDAVEAQEQRELAGPSWDEVAYRRAVRAALRPFTAAAASRTGVAA